jgi:hypothetical protein
LRAFDVVENRQLAAEKAAQLARAVKQLEQPQRCAMAVISLFGSSASRANSTAHIPRAFTAAMT